MRYLFSIVLAFALLTGISTGASARTEISLTVDGELQQYTQSPLMIEGKTVVPMRPIFEKLGATIGWNQSTQSVLVTKGDTQVELKIGMKTAKVNGQDVMMDIEPLLINETTMVSVRFVAEVTNTDIHWNEAEQRIEFTTAPAEEPSEAAEQASPAPSSQKIVSIKSLKEDGSHSVGNAIAIEDGLFVTTAGLLEGAMSAQLITEEGTTFSVEGVVVTNPELGLAVVKTTEKTGITPALTSSAQFAKTEESVSVVIAGAEQTEVVSGAIQGFTEQEGTDSLQIVAQLPEGTSGAAVLNEEGEMIGILTGEQTETGHVAVAVDEVGQWLKTELADDISNLPATFPALQAMAIDEAALDFVKSELGNQHAVLRSKVGSFTLSPWDVQTKTGQVVITAQLDPNQYLDYVKHFAKIKPELEQQALMILELFQAQLPEQQVSLQVRYEKDFAFKPKSFDAEEIEEHDGTWSVRHTILSIEAGESSEVIVQP